MSKIDLGPIGAVLVRGKMLASVESPRSRLGGFGFPTLWLTGSR